MTKRKIEPPHKRLREALRHYTEFQRFAFLESGRDVIEYQGLRFSFLDLHNIVTDELGKLSPRKREAIYYNVLLDKTQDVAAGIMGISTVSVGQYVNVGMKQLSANFFSPEEIAAYERYQEAHDGAA